MDKDAVLGFIMMLFFVVGCTIGQATKAGELYVVSTVKSYHQDREHGYNEKNAGIGLELHVNEDVRLIAGEYKNSFYNKSEYVGAAYMPFHRWNLSAGALILEVNGYDINHKKFDLVAIPAISYNKGNFEMNMVVSPPIFKMGMIGVQVGWKIR